MKPWFAPLVPAVALAAALSRWAMQGSRNFYTALEKRFYVPDPLGWKISDAHPIWIGLEACGVLLAWTLGIAVAAYVIQRKQWRRLVPVMWGVAALSLVLPIAAFASGGRPDGGLDLRPIGNDRAALAKTLTGKLAVPAGTYEVIAAQQSEIIARIDAGGDKFDARFAGELRGTLKGNLGDLAQPLAVSVSVATASIDTNNDKRSAHAREGYLLAEKFPRITFALDKLVAATNDAPDKLAFEATGTVGLSGKTHVVDVKGTAFALDGKVADLRIEASFAIPIKESAFAADATDFSGDVIPVQVSLLLRKSQ